MKLHLEEITRDNWQDVICLKVTANQQRFVMNNLYAIAECKFFPEYIPLAIYDDATIVGMAICAYDEAACHGWVHRLVIGEGFENRGYSTNSMQWIIRRFRRIPGCTALYVHYRPDNSILSDFYRTYGFRETDRTTQDGDVIALLLLPARKDKDTLAADAAADSGVPIINPLEIASPHDSAADLSHSSDAQPAQGWTRPVSA